VIKLKDILSEGYAWERKADGSLPTLADTIAAYEAKMREQAELNMPFGDDSADYDADVEDVDADEEDVDDVEESAKPDYIDADGDGDEEESMKKAFKDKAKKKDVNESLLITRSGEQMLREIPLEDRIRKNYIGNK
jgi:hypothetical protein